MGTGSHRYFGLSFGLRPAGVALAAAAGIALLSGCNGLFLATDSANSDNRPPDVLDRVRAVDLLPRSPEASNDTDGSNRPARAAVYRGTDIPPVSGDRATPATTATGGEGFELNFDNTPVTTVAKVVLGDILGVGYTIDPRVQSTVTLSSGRPISKTDVLFVLENALRASNVALVRDQAGGYRLLPAPDAIGSGRLDRTAGQADPGYGVTVIPLQHVSAATLTKLLDSFALKAGTVRADATRNILLVQGNGTERQAAIETARSFDVDWMRGQSVGIYPIQSSTPEPIIAELDKILDSGQGGLSQDMVKFSPVARMNAIMVVARRADALRHAETWIRRLDNPSTTDVGVKVYRIKYGEARQIARLLNDLFIRRSGGSSLDSASNQIAPGSGLSSSSSSSSTDRLGLGGGQSSSGVPNLTSRLRLPSGASAEPALNAGNPNAAGSTTIGGSSGNDPSSGGNDSSGGGANSLLPNVRIIPDTVNNALLIYANRESYSIIERTLRQIDRPQLQVAIDATIAEVTLNDTVSQGVQFFLKSSDVGIRGDKGSAINTAIGATPGTGDVVGPVLGRVLPGFNFLVGAESQPRVILDALHLVTDVKVLSNPSLVVVDNQPATLQVGDQVPVSTGTATVLTSNNTVVNTIDYRNTGIILRVAPRINVNGKVLLDIEQEISNVVPGTGNTLTPTVSQRKVKSSITVQNGQTVLLAGLISETQNTNSSGIPLLDQLPGALGDAFSRKTNGVVRTELIIFIRPQIIRDAVDAHFVAEELRSKMKGRIGAADPRNPRRTRSDRQAN